ncbi:hypothetical protein OESDEN_11698 [Oesophagostomum dentatum]|uniref:PDZ domain-containing protein n=1 Tax=Oesophagostomum dentatum TaxID=61180 RepID=A0A0B1SX66_OESDE|nr:hypothetical protein OESDEN_11698 [Oesophagostomum dentatum]
MHEEHQPQLVGVVFGSVGATLVICIGIAAVFWFVLRKTEKNMKAEAAAYANGTDVEGKNRGTQAKVSQKDQVTMIDSFKLPRKLLDTGTQKSFSVENVNEASGKVGVHLKSGNAAGFGMTIQGNMNEGIYVKEIVPTGAAYQTGNILPGDRIKTLTISFENMVYEDALTLLSYASPYKVKFELERKIETPPPMDGDSTNARIHPLFRSNTLTHVKFNHCSPTARSSTSDEEARKIDTSSPSADDEAETITVEHEQKSEEIEMLEQKVPEPMQPLPILTKVISEVADSTTIDTDLSKMESSDYASDNTSEYRESESEGGNGSQLMLSPQNSQHTISDRMEITDIIADKPIVSPTPLPPKVETCKALPPKSRPIVSRSPSPRLKLSSKSPSPVPPIKEEVHELPPPITSLPPMSKKTSRIPSAGTNARAAETAAPEFTEARTSRIPKRTDSVKTPIIERKLPALPKSVTQRSHSTEDKDRGDVWSRLYLDKKASLKKTREMSLPPRPTGEQEITSTITSPIPSPNSIRPPTNVDLKFGTLDRERRERLVANQNVLDRQTEELRKLGVL